MKQPPIMSTDQFIKALKTEFTEMARAGIPIYNSWIRNQLVYIKYYFRKYILMNKTLNDKWKVIHNEP